MADGSIRFVADTIDAGESSTPTLRPMDWHGKTVSSPYGVWGALGTAAGEETIDEFAW